MYQQNILDMELYIHMYDSGYNQGILKTMGLAKTFGYALIWRNGHKCIQYVVGSCLCLNVPINNVPIYRFKWYFRILRHCWSLGRGSWPAAIKYLSGPLVGTGGYFCMENHRHSTKRTKESEWFPSQLVDPHWTRSDECLKCCPPLSVMVRISVVSM